MAQVETDSLTTLGRVSDALLRSDANDSLAQEVFNQSGDYTEEGVRSVHTASDRVKDYLKRGVYVSENSVLLHKADWVRKDRTPDSNYIYRLSLPRIANWPVLRTDQDTKIVGEREVFAQDSTITKLDYFAGYRREDQTGLSDLPSNIENEFSNIDDIPILPEAIEDVVVHIAIHSAVLRIKDLVGTTRSEQSMGDFQYTVQRMSYEENYKSRMLNNIQNERYIV